MGEARKRKKLLGNEYGKSSNRNSQVAKIAKDQTLQERKETELSRPPIPDIEYLKSQLSSVELRDWLIDQWSSLVIFETLEDDYLITSKLLDRLKSKWKQNLNSNSTVFQAISPSIYVTAGINVNTWTIWASIGNIAQNSFHATSDRDEFRLETRSSSTKTEL